MKKALRIILMTLLIMLLSVICFSFCGKKGTVNNVEEKHNAVAAKASNTPQMVIPSGKPIGIYVKTKGVMVINTTILLNAEGNEISPCKGELLPGDYIVSVNGEEIEDKKHLIRMIQDSQGNVLNIKLIREGEIHHVRLTPVKSQGKYMLGLWVKDDISGIGTLTYVSEEGFGALGHSINDNDTGTIMSISDGAVYSTSLINIVKSDGNKPGRLEGMIDYSGNNIMGRVDANFEFGIKGYLTKKGRNTLLEGEWMPVASKEEAKIGEAFILSWISGEPEYYRIKITGVDISCNAGNKGLEIEIVDERLKKLTGGIVQGMSGTPIIQNGKLLGAITHVFVRDSSKGYGTFVQDMIR